MKDELFIVIQNLKRSVLKWRILAIIAIFSIIIASSGDKIFKSEKKENSIYRIKIENTINNNMFSEKKLQYILDEEHIKGVILECNSPGGDVVEAEKIYNFFRKIAIKKPLIVNVTGMCASAAYIVAMASDYIIAYNTSIVGSIGVVISSFEITELARKLGINLTSYKSSSLKSSLNPFEKISPDVDMVMSQQINDMYDYFLNIFAERRKIKISDAQEIANGQTYTGRQALDFGLIDKIGGTDEVKEYFKTNNIDYDKMKIVDYKPYNEENYNFGSFIKTMENKNITNKIKAIYNNY